jgi:hypothetical protein
MPTPVNFLKEVDMSRLILIVMLFLAACTPDDGVEETAVPTENPIQATQRAAGIPPLPFGDNPDPTACGIPQQWRGTDNVAYLTGIYEDELVQDPVLLYDSHNRTKIMARAAHGTQVEVVMFQSNPVLDYYYVRIPDAPSGENLGWIPAPFLSFERIVIESPD